MRLFSNRSQMASTCDKNKEVAREPQASVSLMFLPHFFFVLYNDQKRKKIDTHTCPIPHDCSTICAR